MLIFKKCHLELVWPKFSCKNAICVSSSEGLSPPDSLQGLCPRTALGDFCLLDPYIGPPSLQNLPTPLTTNTCTVCEQVMELIQRLQTGQPSDDAASVKSAASNADSGRGASDEGDARQRLLRATGSGNMPLL